eukprot:Protomagalhaensia_wolfi_Nauph_80__2068@NODE_2321_length_1127_cov_69_042279_g1817_i0_p1_GENE_NODE_2321_length_1127_cov_69_042279_g1817_i0NODE_2321_length_1127_cov_69_042279_g1817_i0_p1_ORF_typecomplete_len158_score1_99_NODE_2321_length_1127_cov_69_042279_g1817_i06181091
MQCQNFVGWPSFGRRRSTVDLKINQLTIDPHAFLDDPSFLSHVVPCRFQLRRITAAHENLKSFKGLTSTLLTWNSSTQMALMNGAIRWLRKYFSFERFYSRRNRKQRSSIRSICARASLINTANHPPGKDNISVIDSPIPQLKLEIRVQDSLLLSTE